MAQARVKLLNCPVCGKGHKCVAPRYMYKSSMWMGYICMLYCENEAHCFPVYKLYDEQYHYVGYVSHLWPTWDFSHEEIPF